MVYWCLKDIVSVVVFGLLVDILVVLFMGILVNMGVVVVDFMVDYVFNCLDILSWMVCMGF